MSNVRETVMALLFVGKCFCVMLRALPGGCMEWGERRRGREKVFKLMKTCKAI